MLSRYVIAFLPRSKHLFISWLPSLSAVILEPSKMKSYTVSTFSPSICHEVIGPDVMILVFWMLRFKPAFSLSSFTFTKKSQVKFLFFEYKRPETQGEKIRKKSKIDRRKENICCIHKYIHNWKGLSYFQTSKFTF